MLLPRQLPKQPTKPRAAYLHVPFCHRRCPYCNFTVVADRLHWIERYLTAIGREMSGLGSPQPMETVFIGGGTPTLLPLAVMQQLLDVTARWLPLEHEGEWTIEANPNDVSDSLCEILRSAGVNRISLGGQSFNNAKLTTLGRDHSGEQLKRAIQIASRWFAEVSVDLIFGVPGESVEVWESDLNVAMTLPVSHISTYGLTYEKGAHYWSQLQRGVIQSVDEEVELEMYLRAIQLLTSVGFEHYEISNFAKAGATCRHNETYWSGNPWYAFGPGAASFVDGVRRVNHRSTSTYLRRIESNESPVQEEEQLDWASWTRERFVFGMRKIKGVDWNRLEKVGEPETLNDIRFQLQRDQNGGWLEWNEGRIKLTTKALPVSDGLWKNYLP